MSSMGRQKAPRESSPSAAPAEIAPSADAGNAARAGSLPAADEGPSLLDRLHEDEAARCYNGTNTLDSHVEVTHPDRERAEGQWVKGREVVDPSGTPDLAQLYDVWTPAAGSREGYSRINGFRGTPTTPASTITTYETGLFIGGRPDVADVAQGRIGDCWVLSALMSVVQADPNKIVRGLVDHGDTATFSLLVPPVTAGMPQMPGAPAPAWELRAFTAPKAVITAGDEARGAGVRTSPTPTHQTWRGTPANGTLGVDKTERREAAYWVAVMESVFAQWQNEAKNAVMSGTSDGSPDQIARGQDLLDFGGDPGTVWSALYGPDHAGQTHVLSTAGVAYAADADLVRSNPDVVRALFTVGQQNGTMMSASAAAPQAGADEAALQATLFYRVGATLDAAIARAAPDLAARLRTVKDAWTAWTEPAPQGQGPADHARPFQVAAEGLVYRDRPDALLAADAPVVFRDLVDQLHEIVLSHFPTQQPLHPTDQFEAADHAYAILGASLQDVDHQALTSAPNPIDRVDAASSTVRLRNPWGERRSADGAVQIPAEKNLSLHSFLHDFTHVDVASATVTP